MECRAGGGWLRESQQVAQCDGAGLAAYGEGGDGAMIEDISKLLRVGLCCVFAMMVGTCSGACKLNMWKLEGAGGRRRSRDPVRCSFPIQTPDSSYFNLLHAVHEACKSRSPASNSFASTCYRVVAELLTYLRDRAPPIVDWIRQC
jgi:hypothetical protein